jgi:hypothetical protein
MAKIKLEYIWLDDNQLKTNLRSKTKVGTRNFQGTLKK